MQEGLLWHLGAMKIGFQLFFLCKYPECLDEASKAEKLALKLRLALLGLVSSFQWAECIACSEKATIPSGLALVLRCI